MASGNIVEIVIKAIDETKSGLTMPLKNLKDVETAFGKLKPAALGAVTVVAGAFAALGKQFIDRADELSKLSQSTGIATSYLSALTYTANQNGVAQEALGKSLVDFNKRISEANTKGGDSKAVFDALGISLRETADGPVKSTKQLFLETADALAKFENGQGKTDAAVKLFGKTGADLIPLLNAGSAGIAEMNMEAEQLGQTFSDKAGKDAEAFNDNMDRLNKMISGVAGQVAIEIIPTFVELAEGFIKWAKDSGVLQGAIATIVDTFKVLGSAIIIIKDAFVALGEILGSWYAAIFEALKGNFGMAKDIINDAIKNASQKWDELQKKIADINNPKPPKQPTDATGGDGGTGKPQLVIGDPNELAKQQAAAEKLRQQEEREVASFLERLSQQYQNQTFTKIELIEQEYNEGKKFIDSRVKDEEEAAIALLQLEQVRAEKIKEIREKEAEERQAEADARMQKAVENYEALRALDQQQELDKLAAEQQLAESEGGPDSKLQAMMLFYEQQRLMEQQDYEAKLQHIASLNLAEEDALKRTEKLQDTHRKRMAILDKNEAKDKKQAQLSQVENWAMILGQMANLAQAFGQKGFRVWQALAIASAIMDTYVGANKALAQGGFAGIAMAAVVIGTGLANVSKIASQKPSGAAHGGLDYVPAESTYLLQRGERVLSPGQNEALMNYITTPKQTSGGEVVLNVGGQPLYKLIYQATRSGELQFDARAMV